MPRIKPTLLAMIAMLAAACSHETLEEPAAVGEKLAALAPPPFEGCSDQQKMQIERARADAFTYLLFVMNDLGQVSNGGDDTLFKHWFGIGSDDENQAFFWDVFGMVSNNFDWIVDALEDGTFVCGCTNPPPFTFGQTLLGYQNPDKRIELCADYFTGDYEEVQIGALIHEAAHLANAGHVNTYCIDEPNDWPESLHNAALTSPMAAATSAENLRLYALRWTPDRKSTIDCTRD